ncbi:uncharacterized protein EAF02_001169 [Botrytis sinoallii]|uniref:uncharacterized protein n=1 Tax=Botrytis sinoallii TaxID=1463999 RepID=UPI0018FFE538|nr:uncharacterized protein EAF02_001169 [Botrytis sinoallii]KAF7893631.1 hypothetical protein EAF02_001169 [Botrytis sinoallii]
MCFFDQCQFVCGDYKWGHFRQHCAKEYRTGETCGMKLVMTTYQSHERCKICTKIETKWGRIQKEQERVLRWKKENGKSRQHSIEASEEKIRDLQQEVNSLEWQRSQNALAL